MSPNMETGAELCSLKNTDQILRLKAGCVAILGPTSLVSQKYD